MMEMNPMFAQGNRRTMYLSVTGIITRMMPGNRSGYGMCSQMMEVEDAQGGITNFFTPFSEKCVYMYYQRILPFLKSVFDAFIQVLHEYLSIP